MKKLLYSLIAAALIVGGFAVAQTIAVPQVATVGTTDLIQIIPRGLPSAQSVFATPAQIAGVPGYVKTTPVTAFSLTFGNSQVLYLITPAGTLATGTFTTAPNPSDGQRECIRSNQTQTAVTITANTGQTIGDTAVTAMTANTTYCWVYVLAEATWYRSA